MMCDPCRLAGEYNSKGDPLAADKEHVKCEYRDCTCQHMTSEDGTYIG